MSTTPQTYLEKAKAHCATADKLSDTMRREMRAAFTITLDGKVVRILNGTCRTGTVVALIKRGLVNTATYSDPWNKVNTLTDQGMFVWAALTRRDDFLALAAQKDAEVEAAHTELEADPAVRAAVRQVVDSTPEEMADTGPQGRDWPKNDRSSVATVTSILAANRLPGWCNASALFVGYPSRAVLVHVPAGQDGTRYVQPLADALPYRHARVSFQPKPGSNLSGVVVVHPIHLEVASCPSS